MKTRVLKGLALTLLMQGLNACGGDESIVEPEEPRVESQDESTGDDRGEKPPSKSKQRGPTTSPSSRNKVAIATPCDSPIGPLTRPTVAALEAITKKSSCKDAYLALANVRSLDLSGRDIFDLQPLTFLPHLQTLDISKTKIEDLSPLARLKNLRFMDISATDISSVEALKGLPHLRTIAAVDVPGVSASDFKALPSLQNLYLDSGLPLTSSAPTADPDADDESCSKGAWFYDPYSSCRHKNHGVELYKKTRSEACGVERKTVVKYKSCRHKDHDWEKWESKEKHLYFLKEGTKVSPDERNSFPKSYCTRETRQWAEERRAGKAAGTYELKDVKFKYFNDIKVMRRGKYAVEGWIISNLRCEITFNERYKEKKRSSKCGAESYDITYKSCRHKDHGVDRYVAKPSSACPLQGVVVYGQSSGKQKTTAAGKPLYCADCSHIAATDQATTAKKLACFNAVAATKADSARAIASLSFESFLQTKAGWLDLQGAKAAAAVKL